MPTYGLNFNDNGDCWYEEVDGENRVVLLGYPLQQDLEAEVVMYAKNLKNGMMVIAPRNMVDFNNAEFASPESVVYSLRGGLNANRWCVVTQLEVQYQSGTLVPQLVHFVGVFEDGTSHVFHRDPWTGYWVKKNSILPETPNPLVAVELKNDKLREVFAHYQAGDKA